MSSRPLLSDNEKDKHKTRDQLLKELSELRARLAAKTEDLAGNERVICMLDGITEPVLVLDDASHVVYANSAAARLFAKDREDIGGMSLWDLYPKGYSKLFYNAYETASKTRSKGKFREQHRLLGKWFDVCLYPVPGGMTVLFNDITVSRQMEELPRLALTLLHNLKDNVFLLRADGRLFHVNNETQNSLGYSSDELHKMSILDVVPPSCANVWHDILDRIRQHGSMTFESRLRSKDGREFPVEVYANFIELYGNSYYSISARDITERKSMGDVLEKYRLFSENARDIVLFFRRDGRVLEANQAAEKAYGYTREELLSLKVYDLRADDPGHYVDEQMDTAFDQGILFEGVHRRKDGSTFPVEVSSQGKTIDGQKVLLSVVRDITVRKKVEEALYQSEADLARAQEIAHLGNWELDIRTNGVHGSKELYSIFNFESDAPLALDAYVEKMYPEDRARVVESINAAIYEGKPYDIDYRIVPRPNDIRYVHADGKVTRDENGLPIKFFGTVQDVTEHKQAEEYRKRLIHDLGERVKELGVLHRVYDIMQNVRSVPEVLQEIADILPPAWQYPEITAARIALNSQEHSSSNFLETPWKQRADFHTADGKHGVIEVYYLEKRPDITEGPFLAEERELINTLAEMLRTYLDKRYAEEALTIAKNQAEFYLDLMGHDINNMNQIALGSLEVTLMNLVHAGKLDASGKSLLEKSIESLVSSSQLIRNVQKLQLASVEGVKLQAVDVADVLKGIIDEQRSTPGKDVTIYYKNEATHCLVTANELLRDVFTNIISNAIKHARADRHLTIGVTVESVVEDGRKSCRVAIDDNGSGIPDEVKDRLFRRFSRGETKAKGSGLGLYLVKTLVEHYGGDIRIEDRVPGDYTKGAKFVVTIPSVE